MKGKEKGGPYIPSDSRNGGDQMSTGTADRDPDSEIETLVSLVERLRLWTSGLRGWEGARGTRAEAGRESRKNMGRRGAWKRGLHRDLQNVVSSVFPPHLTLGLLWGQGSEQEV